MILSSIFCHKLHDKKISWNIISGIFSSYLIRVHVWLRNISRLHSSYITFRPSVSLVDPIISPSVHPVLLAVADPDIGCIKHPEPVRIYWQGCPSLCLNDNHSDIESMERTGSCIALLKMRHINQKAYLTSLWEPFWNPCKAARAFSNAPNSMDK